jgi:hypothetical protein
MRKPVRQAQWELSYRGVMPAPPGVVKVSSPASQRNTARAQREGRAKEGNSGKAARPTIQAL